MRAALEAFQLRGIALSAVDRQHVEARHLRRVFLECLGDLDRELARWREDQRLCGAQLDIDLREDGQGEGRRLAGAGLGLAQKVRAAEESGNGLRLDGRGSFVADVCQRGNDGITQAELGKARQYGRFRHLRRLMVPGEGSGETGQPVSGGHNISPLSSPGTTWRGAECTRKKGDCSIYL